MSGERIATGAVGLAVSLGLDEAAHRRAEDALCRALRHFPWLRRDTIRCGAAQVDVWSHEQAEACVHHDGDGNLYVLAGSPVGRVAWSAAVEDFSRIDSGAGELSWDGRCILLRVSADGRTWKLCNDWNGSIQVYHARVGQGRIASTLEPVVVAAADLGADDFFLPGLVSLLVNGHFLGDWTLFGGMKTVPPDSVVEWGDSGFHTRFLDTIQPTDRRCGADWDALVDEMFELTEATVAAALQSHRSWIVPLSAGIDSRLAAGIGRKMGLNLRAYTYGPATWGETVYARQIAKRLDLPWKRVDLGTNYLKRFSQTWAEWFGSSLHFHGMYQMPFLEYLGSEPPGPMIQGYLGDPLAGNHVEPLLATHTPGRRDGVAMDGDSRWPVREIETLLRRSAGEAIEAVADQIEREIEQAPGTRFQRLMLFDLWSRQRRFVSYQPMMYDYWRGVATPFFNRQYARFCFSLPQHALSGRKLQLDMLCRHYPELVTVGGTFGRTPLNPTRGWQLRAGLAWRLPEALKIGPLREFNPTPNNMEPDCMRACGRDAIWPIPTANGELDEWFDTTMIESAYQRARGGDWTAVNQLESIQTVALRALNGRDGE